MSIIFYIYKEVKMNQKYIALVNDILKYGKVGVCLSGGASSALVVIAAVEALGKDNVVAITANTPFFTGEEMLSSKELCKRLGIIHLLPETNILSNANVLRNGSDRCYHCKKCIIDAVQKCAVDYGIKILLDGSCASNENFKDEENQNEKVLSELGIVCPLRNVNISRDDVHEILDSLSMSYYSKPENACLATRIAHGELITVKKIRWIRAAENYVRSLGYGLVRVRVKDNVARVEVAREDVAELMAQKDEVILELKEMGFSDVTIDENGYRREAASCL